MVRDVECLAMTKSRYSLAIETSSAVDSIALGRGDSLLRSVVLPDRSVGASKGQSRGGSSNLMAVIERLFREENLTPSELGEVYVSVGPGSFTGLRIAMATAQMLASVLNVKLVAVPSIEVIAQNAPADIKTLAVCLNRKRDTVYAALFHHDGRRWAVRTPPEVVVTASFWADAPRSLTVLCPTTLEFPDGELGDRIERVLLPPECATPHAEVVWQLGRELAAKDAYTAPQHLLPIYARPPEAVEIWDQRHGRQAR